MHHQDDEAPSRLSRKQRRQYRARVSKYYNAGTFYGQSVAMQLYMLATLLERTSNDVLWYVNSIWSAHVWSDPMLLAGSPLWV